MNPSIHKARSLRFAVPAALALVSITAPMANAQNINVTVDGDVVAFTGQQPVQRFGTVLVPLRGVFEKLGATVAYDGATKTILAVKGATSVSLALGSTNATVNGQPKTLTQAAQAMNGTTLVPLRFVSEALGAAVEWRAASQTVVIRTTGGNIASGGDNNTPAGNAGAVEVASLSHNGDRALRAGDTLTVTVVGTPGANAMFTVPGIEKAKEVPMKETAAGTYVGTFALPAGINVKGATVLASLKKGAQTSPLIQAGQTITVDAVGPTMASLSPAPNATLAPGRPLIYGTLSDAGTGVTSGGTRLLVNGKDVTAQTTVTEAFFSYRPAEDLPLGKNTVVAVSKDEAGNETRKEWAFTLSQAEALITDLTFTPDTKTLEPGDELTIKLTAQPKGKAKFSLGGAVTDRPMTEETSGVYTAKYTVRKGDTLAQAPISVTFTSASGKTVTQTANQSVSIAAGAPDKPTVLTPKAGANVGNKVVVTGKAAPNATIRYHVKFQGTLLILPANGTVADGEVKANAQGEWATPEITLSTPTGVSRLSYTVEVEAVSASGEVSEAVVVEFKR